MAFVWKTNEKQKASAAQQNQNECLGLMSKHFNYAVKYKMKGNICEQISLKVTFVGKCSPSDYFPFLSVAVNCFV